MARLWPFSKWLSSQVLTINSDGAIASDGGASDKMQRG